MAALTCVHHQHLPLYGGGFANLAPCLVMMGVAATTGVLRLVYDEHWASDVITGWAVGAASGYVLPSLLHYGFGAGPVVPEIHIGRPHARADARCLRRRPRHRGGRGLLTGLREARGERLPDAARATPGEPRRRGRARRGPAPSWRRALARPRPRAPASPHRRARTG